MEISKNEERRKPPLFEFAFFGQMAGVLEKLSEWAMPEKWDYSEAGNEGPFPILFKYLNHTFLRLKEQDKIAQKENLICFNTGLVTPKQQEIFMLFIKNGERVAFAELCNESSFNLRRFSSLPERATYFDNPADLMYDTRLLLRLNVDHIIDDPINFARFPKEIQDLPPHLLLNTFHGAIDHAKKRVKRNYKTAIPQYYRGAYVPDGQLQLLLPLCLMDHSKADLALAVYKEDGFYSGKTCLTLDMAINNARLISKPDDEWLRV